MNGSPGLLEDADGLLVGDIAVQGLTVYGQDLVPFLQASIPLSNAVGLQFLDKDAKLAA